MRARDLRRLWAAKLRAGLVGAAVLSALSLPVLAAGSVVAIQAPEALAVGEALQVHATLRDATGRPLVDRPLEVRTSDGASRRARTASDGTIDVRLETPAAGRLSLDVVFGGDAAHQGALGQTTVLVRPAVVSVETVPALPGVPFRLGDRQFFSGVDGVARIEVADPGSYRLVADVPDGLQLEPDTRVSFVRWGDSEFHPGRQVEVAGDVALKVGLSLSHPVTVRTLDRQGVPVPAERISSITLQASNGTRFTYTDFGPHWLMANRVQRLRNGLIPTTLQYAVASVEVDGANVVNRFQQRFTVASGATWDVSLLLFGAVLRSADALFGRSAGTGVLLRYPSGRTVVRPFDAAGEAHFEGLARGDYHVRVVGASGFAPMAPLALSRDQDTTLKVLTTLDIGVLVGSGLALAIGLLLVGRGLPAWRRRRRRAREVGVRPSAQTSITDGAPGEDAPARLQAEGGPSRGARGWGTSAAGTEAHGAWAYGRDGADGSSRTSQAAIEGGG